MPETQEEGYPSRYAHHHWDPLLPSPRDVHGGRVQLESRHLVHRHPHLQVNHWPHPIRVGLPQQDHQQHHERGDIISRCFQQFFTCPQRYGVEDAEEEPEGTIVCFGLFERPLVLCIFERVESLAGAFRQ